MWTLQFSHATTCWIIIPMQCRSIALSYFFFLNTNCFHVVLRFFMQVNSSPYKDGWIIKVELSDSGELNYCSSFFVLFCFVLLLIMRIQLVRIEVRVLGYAGSIGENYAGSFAALGFIILYIFSSIMHLMNSQMTTIAHFMKFSFY